MYSQRWWFSFPFLIALAVLFFLAWGMSLALSYPYDGITKNYPSGLVSAIDPDSPAEGFLEEDDVILFVNGVALEEAEPFYPTERPGDTAKLTIQRDGKILDIAFPLAEPARDELILRLSPFLVAIIFWAIGVGVQAFKPAQESTGLFFAFFQATALLLIAGVASSFGPPWTSGLVRFLFWVIGPLTLHFHLRFPQTTIFRGQIPIIYMVYFLAIFSGLLYSGFLPIASIDKLSETLQIASRLFMAINFLAVVGLLFYVYRNATTAGVRSKIRIVVLGGVVSLLPLVTLIILPDAIVSQPILPSAFMFFFLGILPLTYGYAIFRYRLIEIEKHVNRGATYILVYSLLVVFYLLFSYGLHNWLPQSPETDPLINTVLVLALATVFFPLHRFIQRIVDTVFYGGWYDYRSAVSQITQGLEQITDLQLLAKTVSERLVETLRLEDVCLFLSDANGDFSTLAVAPTPVRKDRRFASFSPLPRSSLTYLLNMGGVVERNVLREALAGVTLSAQELQLLESEQVYLWVPIIGHGDVLGLLALGPKFGGDVFSGEDMDILRVLSRHLSPIIENIHLVTRLKEYAAQLEKRVAERTEELSEAKKRVEAILASVGEGVIVTDLDDTFMVVNDAFMEQTYYNEAEIIGKKIWTCYDIENPSELQQAIHNTVAGGLVWTGDLVGFRKDGSRYDVQLTVSGLRGEDGQVAGYVGSQRDITHQKELDRLKDLFVSDVSHELRTPTTNIGLYLELLENSPAERRGHYLNVLKEQSRLLVKLVEDILDLSRLATGKNKTIEFVKVDINRVVEQVILAHMPLAEAAGLNLEFIPEKHIASILGEPNQLARLINNLVSNAIHYTLQGSVYVRTSVDNGRVCLEVEDTGIGIEDEDRPHLFERFYRGRNVRQSRIHGTGLGLAIVKEIVDMHDSTIEIHSKPGKGSKFAVRFPVFTGEPWLVKLS